MDLQPVGWKWAERPERSLAERFEALPFWLPDPIEVELRSSSLPGWALFWVVPVTLENQVVAFRVEVARGWTTSGPDLSEPISDGSETQDLEWFADDDSDRVEEAFLQASELPHLADEEAVSLTPSALARISYSELASTARRYVLERLESVALDLHQAGRDDIAERVRAVVVAVTPTRIAPRTTPYSLKNARMAFRYVERLIDQPNGRGVVIGLAAEFGVDRQSLGPRIARMRRPPQPMLTMAPRPSKAGGHLTRHAEALLRSEGNAEWLTEDRLRLLNELRKR